MWGISGLSTTCKESKGTRVQKRIEVEDALKLSIASKQHVDRMVTFAVTLLLFFGKEKTILNASMTDLDKYICTRPRKYCHDSFSLVPGGSRIQVE